MVPTAFLSRAVQPRRRQKTGSGDFGCAGVSRLPARGSFHGQKSTRVGAAGHFASDWPRKIELVVVAASGPSDRKIIMTSINCEAAPCRQPDQIGHATVAGIGAALDQAGMAGAAIPLALAGPVLSSIIAIQGSRCRAELKVVQAALLLFPAV